MQIKNIVTEQFLGSPLAKWSTLGELNIRRFAHVYQHAGREQAKTLFLP